MFFKYGAVERAQRTHAEEFYSLRFDERGGSTNSRGALLTGRSKAGANSLPPSTCRVRTGKGA